MRAKLLKALKRALAWLKRHRSVIGKTVLVLAIVAIAALPAVVDNTIIGYLPILLVLFTLLAMALYVQLLRRSITFEEGSMLSTCQRGETVDITVKVTNKSILLCSRIDVRLHISNLQGETDVSRDERFSLLPKESRTLILTARFDHIGTYQVGLQSLKVYDLIGLFSFSQPTAGTYKVQVMPRIVELEKLQIAEEQVSDNSMVQRSVVSDGMDYVGMRDYELGDSMKNIHWKASARFDTFLTRIRERQINPSICVVLDRSSAWVDGERMMQVFDAVVESALSIMSYARDHGLECTIAVSTEDGEVRPFVSMQQWDYADILEVLPRLQQEDLRCDICDTIRDVTKGLYSASTVVVCSANPSERLLSELISVHVRSKHIKLLFAHPSDLTSQEENHYLRRLSRLSVAQVPYLLFSTIDELRDGEL